ncbi:hypothetical protein [Desulfuromonas acetoxidans]|uniref:hypothetical protein n=1 Tax=Desulfuromonas acetoxidans TaxID=891 RepID=UPI00292DA3FB|nr:hypothetical protein [Desulfuromonas acetoxidans]
MDVRQLKNKNLTAFFPLADGVKLQLRFVNKERADQIRLDYIEREESGGKIKETLDVAGYERALAREIVVDWPGLLDGEDPLPVTPENVDWLMRDWLEFKQLVIGSGLSFELMLAASQKEAEKNCSATCAPGSTTPE